MTVLQQMGQGSLQGDNLGAVAGAESAGGETNLELLIVRADDEGAGSPVGDIFSDGAVVPHPGGALREGHQVQGGRVPIPLVAGRWG